MRRQGISITRAGGAKQPGDGGPSVFPLVWLRFDGIVDERNVSVGAGDYHPVRCDERASSVAGALASLGKNYVTQATYMPHGGIQALPMGNDVWQVYSYNSRMQVERIEDAVNNDPSQVLFDQHFEWGTSDNNGNLQSVVTNHDGRAIRNL